MMRVTAGRHVFIWLVLTLVPAVTVTALVSSRHRATQRALAVEWQARGTEALANDDARRAIDAFRTALVYDRDSGVTRLRLAQALLAAGRASEARAHLLMLWEAQPGNGPVNLELGRLGATEHDRAAALRHYHNAIEGAWAEAAEDHRRAARLELSSFLLRDGAVPQAQAELIALTADLPESDALRRRVAALLVEADLPDRALRLYEQLLEESRDAEALAGAGRAAFALGNDALAVRYLRSAAALHPLPADLGEQLEISRLVLDLDPFARRLSPAAKLARARRVLDIGEQRLECATIAAADRQAMRGELRFARQAMTLAAMRSDPDAVDAALHVALRAERLARDGCPPRPLDSAVVRVLARRQQGSG